MHTDNYSALQSAKYSRSERKEDKPGNTDEAEKSITSIESSRRDRKTQCNYEIDHRGDDPFRIRFPVNRGADRSAKQAKSQNTEGTA